MTTTTSKVSPDDQCGVCGTIREEHGDKHHEFNLEGMLIDKKPGPPPRNTPPQPRGAGVESPLSQDPVARLQVRLIERLVAKGLLSGEDLLYIFGAGNADSRG